MLEVWLNYDSVLLYATTSQSEGEGKSNTHTYVRTGKHIDILNKTVRHTNRNIYHTKHNFDLVQ